MEKNTDDSVKFFGLAMTAFLIFNMSITGSILVFIGVIGDWAVSPLVGAFCVGILIMSIAFFEPIKGKVLSLWVSGS